MPRGGLAFYNCGPASGASQPHKHVQVVPLPLDGTPSGSSADGSSSGADGSSHAAGAAKPPIWAAVAPVLQGAPPGQPVELRSLPFAAFAAALALPPAEDAAAGGSGGGGGATPVDERASAGSAAAAAAAVPAAAGAYLEGVFGCLLERCTAWLGCKTGRSGLTPQDGSLSYNMGELRREGQQRAGEGQGRGMRWCVEGNKGPAERGRGVAGIAPVWYRMVLPPSVAPPTPPHPPAAVCTRDFMLLVPRRAEADGPVGWAGVQGFEEGLRRLGMDGIVAVAQSAPAGLPADSTPLSTCPVGCAQLRRQLPPRQARQRRTCLLQPPANGLPPNPRPLSLHARPALLRRSCNSVAFAGSIFVRSKEEIAYVAGKGPLPILAAVGFEWWS